ncbi:MAG: alpha/beta fold hydrolase [Thermoleophilia bacterium]|nr:alpha/beta fold hydrolase [Thermoleophilia bacterium]
MTEVCFASQWRPKEVRTLRIRGRLYLPRTDAEQAPGLVVGHGAGSRATRHHDFCQAACEAGFVVLAFDFRGHGESQGWADGPLELDVLAAVQYLREHPAVNPNLICYRGSSMGGFYGLRAAPEAGFLAMALLCPASAKVMLTGLEESHSKSRPHQGNTTGQQAALSPEPQAGRGPEPTPTDTPRARWRRALLRQYFERELLRTLGEGVGCPVLILHARGDDVVPLQDSLLLAENLMGETTMWIFPGGSHTSLQHDPVVHRLTVEWLLRQVDRARTH